MKKILLISMLMTLVLAACRDKSRAEDPLAPSGRTQRTENLLSSLQRIAKQGYMFGHEDSSLYGVGWTGDSARSDVKDVCNDFPAVIGFEIGGVEQGDSLNIHGTPFDRIRQQIINQYDRGGVSTLSWRPKSKPGKNLEAWTDRLAAFLASLETPYGVKAPVILRLSADFTADQWRSVIEVLRERKTTNALFLYSLPFQAELKNPKDSLPFSAISSPSSADSLPFSAIVSPSLFLQNYPGDDLIDLLGAELYCTEDTAAFKNTLHEALTLVSTLAKEKQKPFVLAETGYRDIPQRDWWTTVLAPVLDRHAISYALLWRNSNDEPKHCHAPYPGQISADDFVAFYNLPKTLFLHDIQGVYLSREQGKTEK